MLIEINDWIKVSTYARDKHFSRTWVDKLINDGTLESIKIDGVKFVKVEDLG